MNRIKVFKNRAMVYLNGNTNKAALIDVEDVELVKDSLWYLSATGYAVRTTKGHNDRMHRLVMGAKESVPVIDHINRNAIDNRKYNLRFATSSLNIFNAVRGKDVGVTFESGKWRARIRVKYKKIHIGRFATKEEALKARKEAELKYFGEHSPREDKK